MLDELARRGEAAPPQDGEWLWTIDDVAAVARVSRWTVYAMVGKDERLPDRRVGRALRWQRSDLDGLLGPSTPGNTMPPSIRLGTASALPTPRKVRANGRKSAKTAKAKKSAKAARSGR